jgi:succinate dehydrogenase/fumarate reductase cytochrome b subunit
MNIIKKSDQFNNEFLKTINDKITALSTYYSFRRKLGPSLTIYKPTILSLISIFLRITGHFFFILGCLIYLFILFFKPITLVDNIFYILFNFLRLPFIFLIIITLFFHIIYGFTHLFNVSEKKIDNNLLKNKWLFFKNIFIYFIIIILLGSLLVISF